MRPGKWAAWALGAASAALALAVVVVAAVSTAPVRDAVRAYAELMTGVNRQDVGTVRTLCTEAYRARHPIEPAEEGGMVGLPRNIHKNFQAWREGADVWICPTNRIGPIYRMTREAGRWKFDGVVGLLRPGGEVVPLPDGGGDSEAGAVEP